MVATLKIEIFEFFSKDATMCDLNGPFRLCSCSNDVDYTKPHWILRMNSINDDVETMVTIGMMMPLNLINKIERRSSCDY